MKHFTVNSIDRNWFKGVSLNDFLQAHSETGIPEEELHDAYAQLKAITEPQNKEDEQPSPNVKEVESLGSSAVSGEQPDK